MNLVSVLLSRMKSHQVQLCHRQLQMWYWILQRKVRARNRDLSTHHYKSNLMLRNVANTK